MGGHILLRFVPQPKAQIVPLFTLAATFGLWCMSAFGVAAGAEPTEPPWLAYGDLRGHLEPCGCDPATDLGGILRIATVLQRERLGKPDLLLFSLGNNLAPSHESGVKDPYLTAAESRFKPTATLFNLTEIRRFLFDLSPSLRAAERPIYLLSNLVGEIGHAGHISLPIKVVSTVEVSSAIVFGYTFATDLGGLLEPVSERMLAAWGRRISQNPGVYRILLFSGPQSDLAKIQAAKLFDRIISSNWAPMGSDIGAIEKESQERLLRSEGPQVWMVPWGGQGLLRGGALLFDEAKSIAEILSAGNGEVQKRQDTNIGTIVLKPTKRITWLDAKAAGGASPVQDIYSLYQDAARKSFAASSALRISDLKSTPYAGAKACHACHPEAAKSHAQSHHAKALETLKLKGKDHDPECVACHTLGYHERGGYVSEEASPQFAGVQCENCHGARLAHTKNPSLKATSGVEARKICTGCHTVQHSSAFQFQTYWPKISHDRS